MHRGARAAALCAPVGAAVITVPLGIIWYALEWHSRFKTCLGSALFAWLISHQPALLFSQTKPATSNQPAVLFSQNKPAPAISHQPTEQAGYPGLFRGRQGCLLQTKTHRAEAKEKVCVLYFAYSLWLNWIALLLRP
jgi:hypothetical protein